MASDFEVGNEGVDGGVEVPTIVERFVTYPIPRVF
jgi:hypothetical protein